MRGRLTIETINVAIDEAAAHCEANSRLMSAARANTVKPADRKRATTLLHCVAVSCFRLLYLLFLANDNICVRHAGPPDTSGLCCNTD